MNKQETTKERFYRVIFGTDTPAGRYFDLALILIILISVIAITIDSIEGYHSRYRQQIFIAEWCFTIIFTAEYFIRLWCSPKPKAYAKSFFGIVDFLSFLPAYIALLVPGASFLQVIRLLRVLRIFRILKLFQYISETNVLLRSMLMARRKILVFIFSVLILIIIFGSLMYVIEGPLYGFTNIPTSVYWAVVTITTVGYGDITPHTAMGQIIASMAMLTGYAILAVPTGIISAELISEMQKNKTHVRCSNCELGDHDTGALYCKHCGTELPVETPPT